MFPYGPRRPMPPHPNFPSRRPMQPRPPQKNYRQSMQNMVSLFKTSDGNLDLEKIAHTVTQINKIYDQVSPMIHPFMSRLKKK